MCSVLFIYLLWYVNYFVYVRLYVYVCVCVFVLWIFVVFVFVFCISSTKYIFPYFRKSATFSYECVRDFFCLSVCLSVCHDIDNIKYIFPLFTFVGRMGSLMKNNDKE